MQFENRNIAGLTPITMKILNSTLTFVMTTSLLVAVGFLYSPVRAQKVDSEGRGFKCEIPHGTATDLRLLMGGAITAGSEDCVKKLLDQGVSPNGLLPGGEFSFPIATAAYLNRLSIVRLLLSNGVGPDSEDARYALFFASGKGNIEVVKLLLEVGVVPNVRLKYGSTPLMFASSYSRVDTIALLLRHNPGVNIQDDHGSSALMEVGDDPTAVELLIENGADIEQTDTDGWTALFCAVHLSELKKMEVLLRKGARTDLRDKSGKSVCDIARKLDDPEKRNATIKTLREFHACTAG